MNIVADENIPFVREIFSAFGSITTLAGRAIDSSIVADADILLVRTVTKVDHALLDGSAVRFVGSPTSGTDHVDVGYLEQKGIAFAHAPGSNANSVAEYVVAALLQLSESAGLNLPSASLGIVGRGHVGRLVAEKAGALGMRCVVNDPPLERETGDALYRPIEEVLACDVITLHVPLEDTGPDPTGNLVDAALLDGMKDGVFLINTARGGVVDETALKHALKRGRLAGCVLDVWENEPTPDPGLLEMCRIETPHIAGYSFDGKLAGARTIFDALNDHFGRSETFVMPGALVSPEPLRGIRGVGDAVSSAYDIMADDAAMRARVGPGAVDRAAGFDALRRDYAARREFSAFRISDGGAVAREERDALQALGFTFIDAEAETLGGRH